jgi:hypothetical protein
MTGNPRWIFPEVKDGDIEQAPREFDFFRNETLGGAGVTDVFVREFVQNALDAKRSDEDKVRISFQLAKIPKTLISDYLDPVVNHYDACEDLPPHRYDVPMGDGSIRVLIAEDFGTTGLNGSTDRQGDHNSQSNFRRFWWSSGVSEKTGNNIGTAGLGKITYNMSSDINTFWGLTLRADDNRELLMGKTLLKPRTFEGRRHRHYGIFAGNDGFDPIDDRETLNRFRELFSLDRGDESGFSVIIPLSATDINSNRIQEASIAHYFYPLLNNDLEITVRDRIHDREKRLTRDNIRNIAEQLHWNDTFDEKNVGEFMKFAEESVKLKAEEEYYEIDSSNSEERWISESFFGSDLERLKNRFSDGELLGFKVPVLIKRPNKSNWHTFFYVFLKQYDGDTLASSDEYYIRSGITLPEEPDRVGNRPIRAFLVAEEKHISAFLGGFEEPAHTKWNEDRKGAVSFRFENTTRVLRFVRTAIGKIVDALYEPPEERIDDFLENIFSISGEEKSGDEQDSGEGDGTDEDTTDPFVPRRVNGGFRVVTEDGEEMTELPVNVNIRAAYFTPRGNPFKNYTVYDFLMDEMEIESENCEIVEKKRNELQIEITDPDFQVKVTGFDSNRDLYVEAQIDE